MSTPTTAKRARVRTPDNPTPTGFRISDEPWAVLEPLLPVHVNTHRFGGGRPRVPDRKCADAIFFVLHTGCQWEALSGTGLCARPTAHDRFQAWAEDGVFLRLWQAGLERFDELHGIDWDWLSMDGAMTKVPLAGANRNDLKLVRETLAGIVIERPAPTPERPQGMCLDKGYDYREGRTILAEFGFIAHIRSRGEEARALAQEAGYRARRWVVERSHSWLNRFRRLLVRWDKKLDHYLAFLHFACGLIACRAAGLFG